MTDYPTPDPTVLQFFTATNQWKLTCLTSSPVVTASDEITEITAGTGGVFRALYSGNAPTSTPSFTWSAITSPSAGWQATLPFGTDTTVLFNPPSEIPSREHPIGDIQLGIRVKVSRGTRD